MCILSLIVKKNSKYLDDCFDIGGNTTVAHTHKIIRKINKTTGAECQSGR